MSPRTGRPVVFAAVALGVVCLLLWGPSFGSHELYDGWHSPGPNPPTLADRLRAEEMRYVSTVRARQGLIQRYGPRKEDVQAYPTSGSYTIWDFFIPAFQCPHHVERIGRLGDGGKWLCGVERLSTQRKCVIYSFGINGESSFEAALMERAPGCEVWGYDFTVTGFGPEIEDSPELRARSHFQPWALGGHNAHGSDDHPKYFTLDALMKLNDRYEGAEFSTLTTFLAANKPDGLLAKTTLPIGQLQLELHAWDDYANFAFFHDWWAALEAAGLRPFWTEPNLVYVNYAKGGKPNLAEYSFINIRGNHTLIYEPTDGDIAVL
ncbi:methyltransferase domain-containing protein [Russula compacta]|nr:methyltransferase domain-containing protein [Russula compacta]